MSQLASSSSGLSSNSSPAGSQSSPAAAAAEASSASAGASIQASANAVQAANQAAASPGTSIRHVVPTFEQNGIRFVPAAFQHCEMRDVIGLVACMLDRLIAHNDTLPSNRPLTRFHSKAAPAITPEAYITRIATFINVDPCILLILLYYIDKLSPDYLTITSLTVHRFLISAICCGSKALSDSFATNSRYAKVGGVELIEMNALEREFLIAIDWRLATSGALLNQYWRSLVDSHPLYQMAAPAPLPVSESPDHSGHPASTAVANEARPTKRSKGKSCY